MKKILLVLMTVTLIISFAYPQKWVEMMEEKNVSLYEIQKEFNEYWKDKKIEKGKGWKQFKRWEYFWEQRVFPSGEFPRPDFTAIEFEKYKKENAEKFSNPTVRSNWTPMGPYSWNTLSYNPGIGRTNGSAVNPNNPNIIFIGAPSGGLWKSIDGGSSWSTSTDGLSVLGVTSIAIDPNHPDTMYIASGDGDAGDTYSIGVLKSLDGGETWDKTGLRWSIYGSRRISKVIINPNNTDILLAATSLGVYRTTNGGDNWSLVQSGNFKDIEFKPSDPNYIYTAGKTVYRSTDGGVNWQQVTTGVPSSSAVNRLALTVTEANPELVYMVAGSSSNSSLYGFYKSNDSGASFTLQASSPNLLGYQVDGSDNGGQSWYDLAIAASPLDSNEVYVGGVNIWKTTDGGTSWTINTHWYYYTTTQPYVHADIHDLAFHGNVLYSGTDGGIYRTSDFGTSWQDISDGISTTQFYGFSLDQSDATRILGGTQDNGTNRYLGGVWTHVLGGDGMETIIDHTNPNTMYAEYYYGSIYRSTNGGANFTSVKNNITESGNWVTPYIMNPVESNHLYAGFRNIWKTTNRGDSWTQISNFSGNNATAMAIAESDTNYIYVAKGGTLYKTSDGGSNWSNITAGLPSISITYIAISNLNPEHVWVTFSGYTLAKKVYTTTDGGANWVNFSQGLPNIPANCITFQKDNHNAVYVGTDVGVYYRDSLQATWQPFMTNLPNVIIKELEIHYGIQKIRAATYGRGIWESPLKVVVSIDEPKPSIPKAYKLMQNSPNPFNPETIINYNLPLSSKTTIEVYNVLGQKVRTLIDRFVTAGYNSVKWDGKNDKGQEVAGGVYMYQIRSGNFIQAHKMLYLK